MTKPSPLQIGQKIYRNVSLAGIFSYEVLGVIHHNYGANNEKSVEQYHVRCLSCSHNGPKCELLVGFVGGPERNNALQFIQCLNNRGEDYPEDNNDEDQSYWHTYKDDGNFFRTLKECKRHRFAENKKYIQKQIDEELKGHNTRLGNLKKSLERAEADIKANEEGDDDNKAGLK